MDNTRDLHNTNNMDNMSEISVLHPTQTVIYPTDDYSMTDILENLCSEINDIRKKVQIQLRKSAPPPRRSCVTMNNEKTVVLHELTALLENKTKILGELTKTVKKSDRYEFPKHKGDAVLTIPETIQKEVTNGQELLERMKQENINNHNEIMILNKAIKFFKEMSEAEIDFDSSSQKQKQIDREIQKDYKQIKKDLDTVIDTLLPDVGMDMKEVIGDLIEASSNNEWYEVEDFSLLPIINQLFGYNMLIRNPENDKKFKMFI